MPEFVIGTGDSFVTGLSNILKCSFTALNFTVQFNHWHLTMGHRQSIRVFILFDEEATSYLKPVVQFWKRGRRQPDAMSISAFQHRFPKFPRGRGPLSWTRDLALSTKNRQLRGCFAGGSGNKRVN